MRKFIIECIIGILALYISGLQLFHLYPPSSITERVDKIHDTDEKIDILNLGTSHGGNISYSGLKLNGFNLNRAGNTLYYDLQNYLFLKKSDCLNENAIVILPISYFVFGLDENRTDRKPDDSFVNEFYYYLPSNQIFSYSIQKNARLAIERIQRNTEKIIDENGESIEKLLEEEDEKKIELKPQKKAKKKVAAVTDSTLQVIAVKRVEHHKKLSAYSSEEKNLNYLRSLIEEILNDGNIPILITSPYHFSYNDQFGQKWLDENYFNIMNDFSSEYNISYLDYSHDTRISLNPNYFKNSDHLNSKGKKVFSNILFDDIDKVIGGANY